MVRISTQLLLVESVADQNRERAQISTQLLLVESVWARAESAGVEDSTQGAGGGEHLDQDRESEQGTLLDTRHTSTVVDTRRWCV